LFLLRARARGLARRARGDSRAKGARLLLAARRVDRLEARTAELRQAGAAAVHNFQLDVQDRAAVDAAIAGLPEEWRAIDVLVNNAGLSRGLDKLWEGKPEDWEEMIDTNVKGMLWVTRAVVPGMVARGRGHVVNLGSTAQDLAYPGGAVYCGTKAAVKLINDGLRQDLMGTPVRVSDIGAGMVETEFSAVRFRGDKERRGRCIRTSRRWSRTMWRTRLCGRRRVRRM
jgi:3-hydroxy acid dehydrogenase / malonic semialdehyde reductase